MMTFQRNLAPITALGIGKMADIPASFIDKPSSVSQNYTIAEIQILIKKFHSGEIKIDGKERDDMHHYDIWRYEDRLKDGLCSARKKFVKENPQFFNHTSLYKVERKRVHWYLYLNQSIDDKGKFEFDNKGRIKGNGKRHGANIRYKVLPENLKLATDKEVELYTAPDKSSETSILISDQEALIKSTEKRLAEATTESEIANLKHLRKRQKSKLRKLNRTLNKL